MASNTSNSKGGGVGRGKGRASNAALHNDESYFRQWMRNRKLERQETLAARGMTYPKSHMHPTKT